ncbi:MAG TPA: PilZ domain-containing protein, partial [Sphingomonadales bacterium]|nr:PilZ domain-containing protein [Sphingomonadales bacterium]
MAKVEAQAEGRVLLAAARDVSIGGMQILTGNPLPVGTQVEVSFILPGTEYKVRTPAVVRRVEVEAGMAIQFTALSAADAEAIQK